MIKEQFDIPSRSRARRGGKLEKSECSQVLQAQKPLSIDFASGVIPIQPLRFQVRLGSLKGGPETTEQRGEAEIKQRVETGIVRPGKRAYRGGAMTDPEGE